MPPNEDYIDLFSRFSDEWYGEGIRQLREMLELGRIPMPGAHTFVRRAALERLKQEIAARSLPPGDALEIVTHYANQALLENSDEDAYRWMELAIHNAERTDGNIEPYDPDR
jgi:hypothetical protein